MTDHSHDFASLRDWIGRQESHDDVVTAAPVAGLAATLDRHDVTTSEGQPLPPLWHWLYFLPSAPQAQLGVDGHPARGGFLPPVPLPRRMWAASKLEFHRPLTIGERIHRVSTITDVQHKQGRSGDLVFVNVRHEIAGSGSAGITEEQQIVYRGAPAPGAATAGANAPGAARESAFRQLVRPDPVLLFRYSALTFNGHRIHYDRPYATQAEGYPGLVVHGPLLATLLLEALHRHLPDGRIARFEFRAQRPLFDTDAFVVAGKPEGEGAWALWAADQAGNVAVEGKAATA